MADMADMAGELMQAKMQSAKQRGQMTHMLRMGNFHVEIVPDSDIDVEEFFTKTMNNIWDRFGRDSLEVKVSGMEGMKPKEAQGMHQ
jgi:hypothetical protein